MNMDHTMRSNLVPRALLEQVARRFRLLGEPVRLEILNLLHARGEMCVQDLVEATGQSQANISKHLGQLAGDGLVTRRKDGLYAYFSIDEPSISGLCLIVCGQLRGRQEGSDESTGE